MDSDPLVPKRTDAVNYQGHPITQSTTGGWTSAFFIIGVEVAERAAYFGIVVNLITYLTEHLGESTATAAAGVNIWSGVSLMMPLLGAFVADSYLGRYRTIVIASFLYILGLGMLTLSALLPSTFTTQFRVRLLYLSLYIVAFAQGGHKPCVQAFGADQFDENDPQECSARSSFFNWWCFGMNAGIIISSSVMSYVQDNISWGIGFGIPFALMVIAFVVFLMGTKFYRYYRLEDQSPFARIGRAFVILIKNGDAYAHNSLEEGDETVSKYGKDGDVLSTAQAAEAKGVLQLFPIWSAFLIFGIVCGQPTTFFTKQGKTMDRRIGLSFQIPPASLGNIIPITIIAFIPIYDRVLVPLSRKITRLPSGLTPLQRVGIGLFFSMMSMVVSALVEIKRLNIAKEFGLIDKPDVMIPMTFWWIVPQYILVGIADVFATIGLQEFFYDQVPDALKSLGLALYLSILGIGSFISGFLVSVIDEITKRGGESWFSNNLNKAHLDYFYWLLAGLSAVGIVIYVFVAKAYVYKVKGASAL